MTQNPKSNLATGHRERVQEKFLSANDVENWADYELLELILMKSIPRIDVKPLAKELLKKFGTIGNVLSAKPEELTAFKYIKQSTLSLFKLIIVVNQHLMKEKMTDKPVLHIWQTVIDYCCQTLQYEKIEKFLILYLDTHGKLIERDIPQVGTTDRVAFYPREILKKALVLGAKAVVISHNHPSGQISPSPQDLTMTVELNKVLDITGITLLDHIIVGPGRKVYSFAMHGHLKYSPLIRKQKITEAL